MTTRNKYLATALLAVLPFCAFGQTNGSNSPYSRYGFGLLSDGANAFNKSMAGTAYGMHNGKELNTKNPASYAAIDSLTFLFDLGLSLQNGNFSQNGSKTNAKTRRLTTSQRAFALLHVWVCRWALCLSAPLVTR